MTSKFLILSGRGMPCFIVDERGGPAVMDSLEEAREAFAYTPMTRALGGVIIEWDENGFVEAHDV